MWSVPLQITLAMYFMWDILGPSTLAGLAVVIILIPVNVVIGYFSRRFQVNLIVVSRNINYKNIIIPSLGWKVLY